MNLSFAGCGFLGIYHIGVACCFRKYAPHLLLNKISGASAGAMAACCLICDLPLGEMTSDVLRVSAEARRRSLGPFTPSFNIHALLLEGLEKMLPHDAHLRVNGKLHVSLTRVHDGKNVLISHFDTRQDLIDALLASAFIPIFSGLIPPKFKGIRYIDGGYSDNLPTLDENTITVSPFCGESDICPRDDSSQLFHINIANTSIELSKHNMYRMVRVLFPPSPEVLSNMCKQGFDDALRFLHRNDLINCTRCLAVQSTFVVSETLDVGVNYDPQCLQCRIHRYEALMYGNMPDTVVKIFQDAIDAANKGIMNWLFKHRGIKLLSVLSLPYTLPVDIVYATFTKKIFTSTTNIPINKQYFIQHTNRTYKLISYCGQFHEIKYCHWPHNNIFTNPNDQRFMALAPHLGNKLWKLSRKLMEHLSMVLNRFVRKSNQITAKISCQMAITEYTDEPDVEAGIEDHTNQLNFNFTFNLGQNDVSVEECAELKEQPANFTVNATTNITDYDTFEHILQENAHHETIMTYYYLDESNRVKVTEIFDVTESDLPIVQTVEERVANDSLQFDEDEDEWVPPDCELERNGSVSRLSDSMDKDTSNIYSDPESEWTNGKAVSVDDGEKSDSCPESDQADDVKTKNKINEKC